jgi:hypothetical protein
MIPHDDLLARLAALDPAREYEGDTDARDSMLNAILRGDARSHKSPSPRASRRAAIDLVPRRRRALRLAALGAVASLAAIGAVEVVASGGSPPSSPLPKTITPAPVSSVDPPLSDAYAVFRRPRTAADVAPSGIEDYVALASAANPKLARRVAATANDLVYLAPSQGGACLLSTSATEESCFSASLLLAGNAISVVECAPGMASDAVEVYGLLPDGATATSIRLANGGSVPLQLADNYYAYTTPTTAPLPVAVSWDQAGVHRETPANVPSGAASCAPQPSGRVPLYLHAPGPVTQEVAPG